MAKVKFGSAEWIQALQNDLNASQAYEEAAKTWEGDFYFVVDPEGTIKDPIYLYMDLWHGKCRDSFVVTDKNAKTPAFVMSGVVQQMEKSGDRATRSHSSANDRATQTQRQHGHGDEERQSRPGNHPLLHAHRHRI